MSELRKALKRTRSTQANLARQLDVSPQVVGNWIKRGVPARWARAVAEVTFTDPRKLCPDFPWPK